MASDFGKWFCCDLVRLVLPLACVFFNLARTLLSPRDVRSPPPLLLSLLLCRWCGAGVVCLWWFDGGGADAVAFVSGRRSVSHTTSAVCCRRRCVCDSLLWMMVTCTADRYHTRYRIGSGGM